MKVKIRTIKVRERLEIKVMNDVFNKPVYWALN